MRIVVVFVYFFLFVIQIIFCFLLDFYVFLTIFISFYYHVKKFFLGWSFVYGNKVQFWFYFFWFLLHLCCIVWNLCDESMILTFNFKILRNRKLFLTLYIFCILFQSKSIFYRLFNFKLSKTLWYTWKIIVIHSNQLKVFFFWLWNILRWRLHYSRFVSLLIFDFKWIKILLNILVLHIQVHFF